MYLLSKLPKIEYGKIQGKKVTIYSKEYSGHQRIYVSATIPFEETKTQFSGEKYIHVGQHENQTQIEFYAEDFAKIRDFLYRYDFNISESAAKKIFGQSI